MERIVSLGEIHTSECGADLIDNPLLNKGTAFTHEERALFGLDGLLPPQLENLDLQVERAYDAFKRKDQDLERHIYLRALQDTNEVLFYRLIHDHLAEMMPIIYTPVVGAACQQFSEIYRRPRGLFISYPERDRIDQILGNAPSANVEVIVVTDGERILGLGDQGAGGMGIPIGKLSLYTACGGISPHTTLPILLDVGTNNQERLDDPLYIGWRSERVTGQDYDDFLDLFVQAVKRRWPHVLLQFEDFAQTHAAPLLTRYRDQLCTFNDDIQGTAAVAVGTLLAAVKAAGTSLAEQRIAMFGAGSAGCGIAEQMVRAMMMEGLNEAEARGRFYMIDRPGLLHEGIEGLLPFQRTLLQPSAAVADWASGPDGQIGLLDVMRHAKPTVLVGVSGQPGTFSQEVVLEMASHCERPIIFPLSNPTSRIEALPSDLIAWTEGRALVATGSPFDPVTYKGKSFEIAQCNNSYIFPAMGLGILGSGATRVSDEMFMAAADALSSQAPAVKDGEGALLPPLSEVRSAGMAIAIAVAKAAQDQGYALPSSEDDLRQALRDKYWQPEYPRLQRLSDGAA
ncbi:MAG: NAD-dependent malic enzyme [Kiloniellales bacterium]